MLRSQSKCMINMVRLVEGRYDYGCVMARIDEEAARKILEFNNSMIAEDMIYEEAGHQYGRETTPHITLKYGLVNGYTEEQMRKMLQNVTPFDIRLEGIGIFEAEKYDVVKFDVFGKKLHELNAMFSKLPNHDEHPVYHPHLSLAYVKPGMGKRFVRNAKKSARVPVNMIEYSNQGLKSYYRLNESVSNVPPQLYHGTSEKLSNKIWKYGLEPGNLKNHPGFKNLNGVYLTTDPSVAEHFGDFDPKDNVVILSVNTKKLDPKLFEKDQASPSSYIYLGKIPAENIDDWKVIDKRGLGYD